MALHARRLARRLRKKGLSLREIAARLAQKGFVTIKGAREGQPYLAQSIKVMSASEDRLRRAAALPCCLVRGKPAWRGGGWKNLALPRKPRLIFGRERSARLAPTSNSLAEIIKRTSRQRPTPLPVRIERKGGQRNERMHRPPSPRPGEAAAEVAPRAAHEARPRQAAPDQLSFHDKGEDGAKEGMKRKTANIDVRVEPQLVERIDAWRAWQRVPPSRSAAIVYMLEQFLEYDPQPGELRLKLIAG